MPAAPATRAFLVHSARRQTVEVRLEGAALVVVNDDGEAARRSFPSEAAAAAEHEKVIAAALAAGFVRAGETLEAIEDEDEDAKAGGDDEDVMVSPEDGEKAPARNETLEAAIVAAPDDPSNYEVYGDWLQARGDPRGKLVAMQCQAARGNHRAALAEQDFRAANAWFLLGASHERISAECELEWRFGFVCAAKTSSFSRELIASLLGLPATRFLRALDLAIPYAGYGVREKPILETLAANAQAAATLTSLKLRLAQAVPLDGVSRLYPRLETLLLRASDLPGALSLPALRELDLGPELHPDGERYDETVE